MDDALIVTPRIDRSRLRDGTVVYSASLDELPGVVVEGPSVEVAVSELVASVAEIRDRLSLPAVGFRTPVVSDWWWTAYCEGEVIVEFGGESTAQPSVLLPEGFRETQPLALV
jgi:hypothetical protein